jgi:hypothetical protein
LNPRWTLVAGVLALALGSAQVPASATTRPPAAVGAPDGTVQPPSPPQNLRVEAGMRRAVISWDPPSDPGSGPLGYRIYSLSNINLALPGTTTQFVYPKPTWVGEAMPIYVVATTPVTATSWLQSPPVSITVYETDVLARTSKIRVRTGRYFRYSATLTRAPYAFVVAPDRYVRLQKRTSKTRPWRTVSVRMSHGGYVSWRVKQRRATYYRVIASGVLNYFGATSHGHLIRMR